MQGIFFFFWEREGERQGEMKDFLLILGILISIISIAFWILTVTLIKWFVINLDQTFYLVVKNKILKIHQILNAEKVPLFGSFPFRGSILSFHDDFLMEVKLISCGLKNAICNSEITETNIKVTNILITI